MVAIHNLNLIIEYIDLNILYNEITCILYIYIYKLFHILLCQMISFAYSIITTVDDFDVHVQVDKDFDLNVSLKKQVCFYFRYQNPLISYKEIYFGNMVVYHFFDHISYLFFFIFSTLQL